MWNQGGIGFARTLHRPFLHHRDSLRHFRRGDHLPVPVGSALPESRLVRGRRGICFPRDPYRGIYLGIQKGCPGVGLKLRTLFALFLLSSVSFLHAAPTLRVVTSAVGPIPVPTGGTAPAQTVEAYNIGDGSLSLTATVSSSAPWLTATVGSSRSCTQTTQVASCIPLQFTLNTSTLAAGTYTGVVT